MKELTEKQKAQRYDEALERAKECHNDELYLHPSVKDVIEHIFPELKESEGEKIRKLLIEAVIQVLQDQYCSNRGVSKEKVVAWLEKQGEQKTIEEVNDEDYGIDGLWHAQRILEKTLGSVDGYQSDDGILEHKAAITAVKKLYEQKPAWSEKYIADVFEKVGLAKIVREQSNDALTNALQSAMIELSKVMPQSSHAWSEEDELIINKILCFCNDFERSFENSPLSRKEIKEDVKKIDNWLKSLKNRIQPKQTWSEEDEKEVAVLEAYIRSKDWSARHVDRALGIVDELVNKVKSLRPQSQWKPSEEQMGVIEAVINNRSFQRRHLDSLYEQLKKLRDE